MDVSMKRMLSLFLLVRVSAWCAHAPQTARTQLNAVIATFLPPVGTLFSLYGRQIGNWADPRVRESARWCCAVRLA
jgi:hypothetical protein